jgi:hypothetical protein
MADTALPSMGGYCMVDPDMGRKALPPDIHGEIVKHGEHGVIFNGVISWILVQKETNPPEIWKNIALKHYSEGEVKEAWKEMAKLKEKLKEIEPKLGLVQKGSRNKTNLELDDIEEALNKLIEAKCMPLVLASSKMMLRAPRFWGKDKGEDISGVAAEVKELKEALVGFVKQNETQMSELKQEVVNANAISKSKVIPRQLAHAQVPETPKTPGGSSKRTRFDFDNEVEEVRESEDVSWKQVTYAQKAGAKQKEAAETLAKMLNESQRRYKTQNEAKKEKAKTKVIYGSAKPETEEVNLTSDVSLVAFNVNKNCNKDVMKTFLIEKGIDVVDVIEMTREEVLDNVRVKSMKVIVKASEFEKAMDPTVWPCRVGVRLWKDKEAQKARFERWQEQNKGRSSGDLKGRNSGAGSGAKERGRAKDAGSQQKNSYRNREKSGNRYQGNIFEELLRQVLKA